MRSLPWTSTSTSNAPSPKGTKRKRNVSPVATSPRTEPLDPIDSSSEDFDNTVQDKESQLEDAMIPGYANDDAYIMVEHDLLEQAKSVTRHIHLEAYKRQISAPVAEEEIVRPTVANRRKDTNVSASEWEEEEKGDINENGLQSSTLDELLSEKPAARVAPATPIKRRTITVSSKDNAEKRREKNSTFGLTATTKPTSEITGMGQDIRIPVKDVVEVQEDEDEDDEEDLDRRRPPRKISKTIPQPKDAPSKPPAPIPPNVKSSWRKPSVSNLEPDWLFGAFDIPSESKPLKTVMKRDKAVSLAAQLEQNTIKLMGKKQAVSLKDQFKFMDS